MRQLDEAIKEPVMSRERWTKKLPDQSLLFEILSYDPETGMLHHKERKKEHFKSGGRFQQEVLMRQWNSKYAGNRAFAILQPSGYYRGYINGVAYLAHRVVWKLMYGYDPIQVDHVNHARDDNRLVNLAGATHRTNTKNLSLYRSNKSGFNGINWHNATQKWASSIRVNNKQYHIGIFDNIEDAVVARKKESRRLGFHENHGLRS